MTKRINIMATWKEFNPTALKSMKDDFSDKPSPICKEILAYLDKGEVILAAPSNAVDVFTGESINQTNYILTDGEYSWGSTLCYYIKKYNLQLPEYFEKKILDNLKI